MNTLGRENINPPFGDNRPAARFGRLFGCAGSAATARLLAYRHPSGSGRLVGFAPRVTTALRVVVTLAARLAPMGLRRALAAKPGFAHSPRAARAL